MEKKRKNIRTTQTTNVLVSLVVPAGAMHAHGGHHSGGGHGGHHRGHHAVHHVVAPHHGEGRHLLRHWKIDDGHVLCDVHEYAGGKIEIIHNDEVVWRGTRNASGEYVRKGATSLASAKEEKLVQLAKAGDE